MITIHLCVDLLCNGCGRPYGPCETSSPEHVLFTTAELIERAVRRDGWTAEITGAHWCPRCTTYRTAATEAEFEQLRSEGGVQ